MNKTTKQLFERFTEMAKLPTKSEFTAGKGYKNSFLKLDYNPVYGGYIIMEVLQTTGENFFDSSNRLKNSEMQAYIRGLIQGYKMAK